MMMIIMLYSSGGFVYNVINKSNLTKPNKDEFTNPWYMTELEQIENTNKNHSNKNRGKGMMTMNNGDSTDKI